MTYQVSASLVGWFWLVGWLRNTAVFGFQWHLFCFCSNLVFLFCAWFHGFFLAVLWWLYCALAADVWFL